MLQFISSLLAPAAILGLAYVLYPELASLPDDQLMIIRISPLALAGVHLSLCLRFNRSRLFFAGLNLTILYAFLIWVLPSLAADKASVGYELLCLLMPLNLLVFSELKERGVFTWWGSTRFMMIIVPLIVGGVLILTEPIRLGELLSYRFAAQTIVPWVTFNQPALLLMLVILLTMNGRLFAQPTSQRGALFVSLIALLAILHFKDTAITTSLLATAVLLMYLLALIQESWSMAYIDHLTDLPGRRALNEQLLKLSGNYSIAMLDIDHFKKFNDRYGHDAGDEVLRMVAARIRKVGSGGRVYRYGGEEFTIVFTGKSVKEALENLDDIREQVADSPFFPARKERRKNVKKKTGRSGKRRGVTVTISAGVSERSERYPSPAEVIKAADKALYRAKKKGRNQVSK